MLRVSGSQLMKHPTLKTQTHTIEPRNGPIVLLFEAESDSNKVTVTALI